MRKAIATGIFSTLIIAAMTVSCVGIAFADESWGGSTFSMTVSGYNADGTIASRSGLGFQTGSDSLHTTYDLTTNSIYTVLAGKGALLSETSTTGTQTSLDQSGKVIKNVWADGDCKKISYKYDSNGFLIGGDYWDKSKETTTVKVDGTTKTISEKNITTTGAAGETDLMFGELVFRSLVSNYTLKDTNTWDDADKDNIIDSGELTATKADDANSWGRTVATTDYARKAGRNVVTDTYQTNQTAESKELLTYLSGNFDRLIHFDVDENGKGTAAGSDSDGDGKWENAEYSLRGQTRWSESTNHMTYDYDASGHLTGAMATGGMQGNNGDGYYNTWGANAGAYLNGGEISGTSGEGTLHEAGWSGDGAKFDGMLTYLGKITKDSDVLSKLSDGEKTTVLNKISDLKSKLTESYYNANIQAKTSTKEGNLGQGMYTFYTITETGQAKEQVSLMSTFSGAAAGKIPNQVDPTLTGTAFKDTAGNWFLRSADNGIVALSGQENVVAKLNAGTVTVDGGYLGYGTENGMFVVTAVH